MANKRETSSQRRQRENRARRAALEARTTGAPPARPSRVAPSTADKLKRSAETKSSEPAGASGSTSTDGKAAKPKRVRPPRPGDKPVDLDTLEGSWFSKVMHVPGGTQVLFAMVMALVATGLMSFTSVFISDADRQAEGNDAKATLTVWEAFDPGPALVLVGVPLLIVGFALWSTLKPQRRRVWLVSAVVMGALALWSLQLYLIVAGFLGYAVFRASKVEGPNEPLLRSLRNRGRGEPVAADGEPAAVDGEADPEPTEASLDLRDDPAPDEPGDEVDGDGDGPVTPRKGFFSR